MASVTKTAKSENTIAAIGNTAAAPNPKILSSGQRILQAGDIDQNGREIFEILLASTRYQIYSTQKGVDYYINPDRKDATTLNDRYFQISDEVADFDHLLFIMVPKFANRANTPVSRAKFTAALGYERELARCIGKALDGRVNEAKKSIRRLLHNMRRQTTNRIRVLHLAINLACTCIVWLGAVLYLSLNKSIFGFNVQYLAIAAVMGSFGALFSTASRLANMPVDPTVSISVQWVYASQRILVGVLGAVILLFGFESGILQNVVQPPSANLAPADVFGPRPPAFIYWLGFVSIIAGFSERLVPNLLQAEADRIEERQQDKFAAEKSDQADGSDDTEDDADTKPKK